MKLQVTIPCYNEEKNIPLILERFQKVLNRSDVGLLLVNNGSTDNSAQVLKELISKYPLCFYSKSRGKSRLWLWNLTRFKGF